MKKLLSVFCMAVIAGGLLFSSCGKNYTITVKSNNNAWGTVTGGGTYEDGATATLTATANDGYQFVKWNDGNTENPRTITVTQDQTFEAQFEAIEPGVKVSFNGANWSASRINGYYYTDLDANDVIGFQGSADIPKVDVCMYASAEGTYSDVADDQGYMPQGSSISWIEYYEQMYLQDQNGYRYGDWWAKSATVVISSFDANSLEMTSSCDAVMFDAKTAFADGVGVDAAPTAPMNVKMTKVSLQSAASAKSAPMKKFNGSKLTVK